MYSKIINPETGRMVNVDGRLGKEILKNYLNVLHGGASSKSSTLFPSVVTNLKTTSTGSESESDSSSITFRNRDEVDILFTPPKYNQKKRGVNDSDCAYFYVGIAAQYVMGKNFDEVEEALMENYLTLCPKLDPTDEGTLIKTVIEPFYEIFADTIYNKVIFEDNMRGMKLACSEMIRDVIDKDKIAVIDVINIDWDTHSDRFIQGSSGHKDRKSVV